MLVTRVTSQALILPYFFSAVELFRIQSPTASTIEVELNSIAVRVCARHPAEHIAAHFSSWQTCPVSQWSSDVQAGPGVGGTGCVAFVAFVAFVEVVEVVVEVVVVCSAVVDVDASSSAAVVDVTLVVVVVLGSSSAAVVDAGSTAAVVDVAPVGAAEGFCVGTGVGPNVGTGVGTGVGENVGDVVGV